MFSSFLVVLFLTHCSATLTLFWSEHDGKCSSNSQQDAASDCVATGSIMHAERGSYTSRPKSITKRINNMNILLPFDINSRNNMVYFAAQTNQTTSIYQGRFDPEIQRIKPSTVSKMLDGLSKRIGGIANDWIANNLYVLDQGHKRIVLIHHEETNNYKYAYLLEDGLYEPQDIAVHPKKGFLFLTDRGRTPRIERANLDGTNRRIIISTDITSPNGLAVDYLQNRLYWIDVKKDVTEVQSSNLNGTNRRVFLSRPRRLSELVKLNIVKENIFITDIKNSNILNFKKSGFKDFRLPTKFHPYDIAVYDDHNNNQSDYSPCLRNTCQHICTSAGNTDGYNCMCENGYNLIYDGVTCKKGYLFHDKTSNILDNKDAALIFSDSDTIKAVLLKEFVNSSQPVSTNLLDFNYKEIDISLVAIDAAEGIIFCSASLNTIHEILSYRQQGEFMLLRTLATNIGLVRGIAVDYVTQNIYWTDSRNNHIMVSSYDGIYKNIVIETDNPRDIEIDPIKRYMFWMIDINSGHLTKVMRAELNGRYNITIATINNNWDTVAMAIDCKHQRLSFSHRGVITSMDYNGQSVTKITSEDVTYNTDILEYYKGLYYIYDGSWGRVHTLNNKTNERNTKYVDVGPNDMAIYQNSKQPYETNFCSNNNGGCEQICLPGLSDNNTCLCSRGLELTEDGQCTYRDFIQENFILVSDSIRQSIVQIDLNKEEFSADADRILQKNEYVRLPTGPFQIINAIDFDPINRQVYVNENCKGTILKSSLGGRHSEVVQQHGQLVIGIVVDHLNRLLFWADLNKLYVSSLDFGETRVLWFSSNVVFSVAIDSVQRLVFWFEYGYISSGIKCLSMATNNYYSLVESIIGTVSALAVDSKDQTVYWSSTSVGRKVIERISFDKSNRTILKYVSFMVNGMAVDDLYLYVSNFDDNKIMRMKKTGGNLDTVIEDISGKLVLYKTTNVDGPSCQNDNGGCSDICVSAPNGRICVCPIGSKLHEDGVTCSETDYSGCGYEKNSREKQKDYYLRRSGLGSAPWLAAIFHMGKYICTGTLINDEWIVTSYSCMEAKEKNDILIYFGDNLELVSSISKIVFNNDSLALVKLSRNMSSITPICLPSETVSKLLLTRTRGRLNRWFQQSSQKHEVYLRVHRQRRCFSSNITVSKEVAFCVGSKYFNTNLCDGTSGESFSIKHNKVWYLFGVDVWSECKDSSSYNYFSKIPSFLDWVYSRIAIE